ncbi:MAG TPA: DNA repair protein RecO [Clostridiales bacterium]|nr:DNA repair protein RecO [Clostridiales bacterium]HQP70329.1 DNA repair protein RecO [Clostridiales bacterium]
MKEYLNTHAIVTGCSAVKENSALVNIMTPDFGIISFVKHGFSSKKNIYKPVLQPMNQIEIQLEKSEGKYRLIDCSVLNTFDNVRSEYKKTTAVMAIFTTLAHSEINDHNDHELVYMLVKKLLETLNGSTPCVMTASVYFYFQLAWCMGISFSFGDIKDKGPYYLDIQNGNFLSGKPPEGCEYISVSDELISIMYKFRNIRFADIDKLNYITVSEFSGFRNMYKKYTQYHFCRAVNIQPAVIE